MISDYSLFRSTDQLVLSYFKAKASVPLICKTRSLKCTFKRYWAKFDKEILSNVYHPSTIILLYYQVVYRRGAKLKKQTVNEKERFV